MIAVFNEAGQMISFDVGKRRARYADHIGLTTREIKNVSKCPLCNGSGFWIVLKSPLNRRVFEIDTLEKAKFIIALLQMKKAEERLSYLFDNYPETKEWTHQEIGEVAGLERETVTRAMHELDLLVTHLR